MRIRFKVSLLVVIIAAFAAMAPAQTGPFQTPAPDPTIKGKPFSSLIVFSGSLSDTGNYAAKFGDFPPPFYNNRTTNGPNVIDIFSNRFGLSSAPSLHLVGPPKGLNFAVLHANAFGDDPGDLPAQLRAYLDSHNNKADPDALYFVFIGVNDIVQATTSPTDQEAFLHLTNAIFSVENAFRSLHNAGAKIFYAPNNVNVGLAPEALQFGPAISARATNFTITFNEMWEQKLSQLERELDITIYRFDFYRMIQDIVGVSGTLGFTDITHSCIALGDKCDPDRFGFINELLPTRRIHEFFGNALAEALIQQLNDPPRRNGRGGRNAEIRSYSVVELPAQGRN